MTDDRRPIDDEALAAYLAGDLPEPAAAALERRLAADADLARRLDRVAAAVAALRDAAPVAAPPGFEERLAARLAAERAALRSDRDELATMRARRRPWAVSRRWALAGSAAAALVAVAVVAAATLPRGGVEGGGADGTAFSQAAGEAGPPGDAGGEVAAEGPGEARARAEEEPLATDEADRAARLPAAVVGDRDVALVDPEAVVARYRRLPEVRRLVGRPAPASAVSVRRWRRALPARAPAALERCLPALRRAHPDGLALARAETVRYAGTPAVAYVVVVADRSRTLAQPRVVVVARDDCRRLLSRELPF